MTTTYTIRSATRMDAARIADLYAPYVRETPASFETEPPQAEDILGRIEAGAGAYPWLVAEDGAALVGYAYAGEFRNRAAYRLSAEVSVYIDMDHRGRGAGRALMNSLLAEMRTAGFATALAGVTLPNPASVRLFESLGFGPVGVFRNVGYKLGRWHDVGWWQLALREFS